MFRDTVYRLWQTDWFPLVPAGDSVLSLEVLEYGIASSSELWGLLQPFEHLICGVNASGKCVLYLSLNPVVISLPTHHVFCHMSWNLFDSYKADTDMGVCIKGIPLKVANLRTIHSILGVSVKVN